jgi:hypothetical protein
MKYIKTVVSMFVAVLFATAVYAAPATNAPVATTTTDAGRWTLSLSGAGQSAIKSSKLNNSSIGTEFELGHSGQFILPVNAGVRQGIAYSDANGSSWNFSTKAYADWTLVRLGNLEFDAGGNVGVGYGNQTLTYEASPEVVARVYLKKDVDLFGRVEYPFNLNPAASENTLRYNLGLRVSF